MIVDKVIRWTDHVIIIVRDREESQPTFFMATIANPDRLIQLIKDKFASMQQPGHTPPADPYAQKFELLKTALEGRDIGD